MESLPTARILFSVAGIWTLAVMTPGPNFFLTLQTAVGRSRPAALWSALGTACGTVVWGVCGFFGIALLFRTAPLMYAALKLMGGGYLVYLGSRLLVRSFGGGQTAGRCHPAATSPLGAWRAGLLTNLSNPKTAAFITSLFAASMPAEAPLWLGIASVALMTGLSLMWYSIVACLFSRQPFTAIYQRSRRWLDRTAALIFVAFGARLAAGR